MNTQHRCANEQYVQSISDELIITGSAPISRGLAGFFLLVSAASNMISMYRRLENGQPTNTLIMQQVIGGALLVLFAISRRPSRL